MALTINRKDEINDEEFKFIKEKFGQKTNSRAIYASIKFIVNYLPDLEAQLDHITLKVFETNQNYLSFLESFKKKINPEKDV
ncbi:MAG: hypothetical protein U0W24_20735 [Bacteroidales bacterium]